MGNTSDEKRRQVANDYIRAGIRPLREYRKCPLCGCKYTMWSLTHDNCWHCDLKAKRREEAKAQ